MGNTFCADDKPVADCSEDSVQCRKLAGDDKEDHEVICRDDDAVAVIFGSSTSFRDECHEPLTVGEDTRCAENLPGKAEEGV